MIQSKHIIAAIVLILIIYHHFNNRNLSHQIFKQDVNIGLWAVLTVLTLFFAVFSVYFTNSFKDISGKNNHNIEIIKNITTEATSYKQKIEEVFSSKKRVEEQKKDLEIKYQVIRETTNGLQPECQNQNV